MGPMDLTPGWSLENARICLQASINAYERPNVVSDMAHALIVDCGNAIIVAFRGTKDIRDFVTDAECFRGPFNEETKVPSLPETQEVHCGFACAWKSIAALIPPQLPDGKPVFVTGHSLGGALAILCAQYLQAREFCVQAVYTFGQPRVGNGAFARACHAALGSRTWRVVNRADIVPRLPGWLMGYRHAGQEVFVTALGPLKFNPSLLTKAITDGAVAYSEWKHGRIALLADHSSESGYQANGIGSPRVEVVA